MDTTINIRNYIRYTLAFSLTGGLLAAFLFIPATGAPSLGLTLWFLLVLVGDLIVITRSFPKIHLNLTTILLILSYSVLSFSFIFSTQNPWLPVLFLLVLFPLINLNLATDIFKKNFITRYVIGTMFYLVGKLAGFFDFIPKLMNQAQSARAARHTSKSSMKKLYPVLKLTGLFLVIGFPVILIAVLLLRSANTEYAGLIDSIFLFDFSLRTTIARIFIAGFLFLFLLTEVLAFKSVFDYADKISGQDIKASRELKKYVFFVLILTICILNIFLIPFVYFELVYDFSQPRELLELRDLDSFSQLAVSRFWELILVAIINAGLIYYIASPYKSYKKGNQAVRIFFYINAGILLLSTLFLIFSAHQRLWLYESTYGFTNKRFLAHTFLPLLGILVAMVFSGLLVRKHNKLFYVAFGITTLFFAIQTALPNDYLVNKINYELAQRDAIEVYDPTYTIPLNGESSELFSSRTGHAKYQNDVYSADGILVAVEVLNDESMELSTEERELLEAWVKTYLAKIDEKEYYWREYNIMRQLIKTAQ
ncbi:MAG: DUF4153 domain-containing protein [Candidatus Dojkabacteria bacterium]